MAFEFKLPDIGEGVVEGEIVRWLVQEGDDVEEDEPLVEVMTDKATVEIPSPHKGTVAKRMGREGDVVKVGEVLIVIKGEGSKREEKPAEEKRPARQEKEPVQAKPESPVRAREDRDAEAPILATPAVRRLAREMEVDLSQVEGSGPGGRITREDLQSFERAPAKKEAPARAAGPVEKIPYRGLRKKIGEHLSASKNTIPHFTYVEELDASELVRLRKDRQNSRKESQVRLTYLPFIIQAVVRALKEYPILNSTLDEEQGVIEVKQYYNIGIATDTDDGLVVPVIKQADEKGVWDLAEEISRLAQKARAGKLEREDFQDGTFTITSLGALGGIMATPIINHPEVAILGIHKIQPKPVVSDGEIAIREMMNLSISLDHRVVDGATGARFMHSLIGSLEKPG